MLYQLSYTPSGRRQYVTGGEPVMGPFTSSLVNGCPAPVCSSRIQRSVDSSCADGDPAPAREVDAGRKAGSQVTSCAWGP